MEALEDLLHSGVGLRLKSANAATKPGFRISLWPVERRSYSYFRNEFYIIGPYGKDLLYYSLHQPSHHQSPVFVENLLVVPKREITLVELSEGRSYELHRTSRTMARKVDYIRVCGGVWLQLYKPTIGEHYEFVPSAYIADTGVLKPRLIES